MSNWIYNGIELSEPPKGVYGFLYAIYAGGKIYFGKKTFTYSRTKRLSERARKEANTRKRKVKTVTDSQWRDYYGSCKPLLEWIEQNGKEDVNRIILGFAKTKQDLTYWEMVLLVREEVLFRDDVWNGNVLAKFYKGKINQLIN